jgi:hypothetical protein
MALCESKNQRKNPAARKRETAGPEQRRGQSASMIAVSTTLSTHFLKKLLKLFSPNHRRSLAAQFQDFGWQFP